jgi:SAM-dependent methyltransferase
MSRIAPFRPERFASASNYYVAARPRYAFALIERLVREAGLGRSSRVLDLGCGPGTLAIPLARYAGTVIGIVEKRTSSIDDLISRALSQSNTTPEALGEKRAPFEDALRKGLLAICPSGQFPEIIESAALLARRAVAP